MSGYFLFAQCMVGFIYPVVSEKETMVGGGVQPTTLLERKNQIRSTSLRIMQLDRGWACMGLRDLVNSRSSFYRREESYGCSCVQSHWG